MGRRMYDDVIFDNTIFITDEKKTGLTIIARIFQFLVIVGGCWSIIYSLQEGFMIPAEPMHLNIAILLASAVIYALWVYPSFDGVKLFFGCLFYGLFLWSRLPAVKNGFYIIENLVIDQLSQYYGFDKFRFVADYSTAEKDTTLIAILFLIPIIFLLTLSVVRSRLVNVCSLILFLPVSLCFVAGLIPSERHLITYILSMLYLTKAGYSHHNRDQQQKTVMHRIYSHAAIWLTLFCCALFFIMRLLVPQKTYEGITEIPNMKKEIQAGLFDFTLEDVWKGFGDIHLPGQSKSRGGLNGGELGTTAKVEFTNSEQLRLRAPLKSAAEGIYLKGYVGSVYTGKEWKEHGKAVKASYNKLADRLTREEFDPMNQVSLLLKSLKPEDLIIESGGVEDTTLGHAKGSLSLEYEDANRRYMYIPYFTDYSGIAGVTYEADLYPIPNKRIGHYDFTYYFNLEHGDFSSFYLSEILLKTTDYLEKEKEYRSFVYQTYTKLPEQGLEHLRQEFSPSSEAGKGSLAEKIEYVRKYLHSNTQYSLEPGKLPKDKDFVEYFLYENKLGYCAHYASAAVLMLRSLGVPARYAEGYAIGAMDINTSNYGEMQEVTYYTMEGSKEVSLPLVEVSVRDYNAHAWVEVYFDYCGWIPVEFTPGASIDFNSAVINELTTMGDNLAVREEEATRDIPTPTPVQPSPTQAAPSVTPEPTEASKEAVSTGANNEKPKESKDLLLFVILGFAILVVLLYFIIYQGVQRRRDNQGMDNNKRAILLFRHSEKLLKLWKALPKNGELENHHEDVQKYFSEEERQAFIHFIETARRARYGKGTISTTDLDAAENFHQELYKKIYDNLPLKKKLYLKIFRFG